MEKEKDNAEIFSSAVNFTQYFNEELSRIDELAKELDIIDKIVSDQIAELRNAQNGRGVQTYLTKHMENYISIKSQKQALAKDRLAIKKMSLDYAVKNKSKEETNDEATLLINEISKMVREQKEGFEKSKTEATTMKDVVNELKKGQNDN